MWWLAIAGAFIVGMILGSTGVLAWWIHHTRKPEVARRMLHSFYQRAHPHWLQVAKDDPRRGCPVCGWTEKELSHVTDAQLVCPMCGWTEP